MPAATTGRATAGPRRPGAEVPGPTTARERPAGGEGGRSPRSCGRRQRAGAPDRRPPPLTSPSKSIPPPWQIGHQARRLEHSGEGPGFLFVVAPGNGQPEENRVAEEDACVARAGGARGHHRPPQGGVVIAG